MVCVAKRRDDPRQSFTWSVASAKPEVFDALAVLFDEKNEIEGWGGVLVTAEERQRRRRRGGGEEVELEEDEIELMEEVVLLVTDFCSSPTCPLIVVTSASCSPNGLLLWVKVAGDCKREKEKEMN